MKPLRDGIVIWLQWAAGKRYSADAWFDDGIGISTKGTLCQVCGYLFDPGPRVIFRSATKESLWAGTVQHALNHIRDAGIRRSTIEALEALAALIGPTAASHVILGPLPKKAVV